MKKKWVLIFLGIILALTSFFRLWQLDLVPPGLYPDEAMNGNNALEALDTREFKQFYSENNGREGLYINIVAMSLKIFGNKPWAIRLVSALFGILTVLGIFLLTKELFKKDRIALFASFFIAASFWHILFSRIGFRAIMAPFFLVWSFWLLYKILGNLISKPAWKLSFQAGAAGLLFGLGFHSYIAYRVAPLLLIFPLYQLFKNKQKKLIIIFLLFTFLAGLPLGWFFLKHPQDFFGRTSQISIFSSESPAKALAINTVKTIGMFFVYGDTNWRHNLAGSPQLWWPIAILFLLGILNLVCRQIGFGIWNFFRNLKLEIRNFKRLLISPKFFLLSWLILGLMPTIISNEGLPHALRSLVVIPPVIIFAALGLENIIEKVNNWLTKKETKHVQYKKQLLRIKKELMVLLAVLFLAIASYTFTKYFIIWGENEQTYYAFNEKYEEIGNYLNSFPAETEKYVIINASGILVKDIPMPSQTIMFITDTYTEKGRKEKNISYLLPNQIESVQCENSCVIAILETDFELYQKIGRKVSNLKLKIGPGFEIFEK